MAAYVTKAEVNAALFGNKRWRGIPDTTAGNAERDAYIAAAANAINMRSWSGNKSTADGDPNEFPRTYGGAFGYGEFTESAQMKAVKQAMFMQIQAMISAVDWGKADQDFNEPARVYPQQFAQLAPWAADALKIYRRHNA